MATVIMFLIGAGTVLAAYAAITYLPGLMAKRQLDQRLQDMSSPLGLTGDGDSSVIKHNDEGPVPALNRLVAKTNAGSGLKKLIDQSGIKTTPGAVDRAGGRRSARRTARGRERDRRLGVLPHRARVRRPSAR